jgi:hypothetical protein
MEPRAGGNAPAPQHPRGTLAIVGVFGVLFLLGWLFMYYVVFAGRGPLLEAGSDEHPHAGAQP